MENQEFGAIFPDNQPDPLQTFQQQREFNLQQQRYNQQMQMQKDNHDFQLIKYLGDTLDPSHYGTGSEFDTKINSGLSDIMNNATQMIKSKQSPADIAAYTQMAANQINNWAQKAKAINDNINQRSQLLAKQGINPDALTRYAKAYAFHDQNGNLKDGNSLDPNQDYTQHILDNYPQAVATDNSAINAVIKGSEKHPIRSTGSVNVNGVKRNVGYGGEYYPGFNVGVDADRKSVV